MSVIRDAEIEATLDAWTAPLLQAAGMGPRSVRVLIVAAPDVNAFVAGGANIFIFTGLLLEARSPEEVTGVIAHELGHVVGGHLIAGRQAARYASYKAILLEALGMAAGAPGLGTHVGMRDLLAHSRAQESAADQAAVTFLERAGMGAQGLPSFLAHLGALNPGPSDPRAAYTRTHPLTGQRLDALERRVAGGGGAQMGPAADAAFARMQAKTLGYLHPERVARAYPASDTSVPAVYARAVAAWRASRLEPALAGADALLNTIPNDPYFLELKGQILLEAGDAERAVPYYQRAVAAAPQAGLIRIGLGHALLEAGDPQTAARELTRAVRDEPRSALAHRLLATAHGRLGDEPRARLHLAEEAALRGRTADARAHAAAALKGLPPGSAEALQAGDILAVLDSRGQAR
jgi:predicted Zn-dependent protease